MSIQKMINWVKSHRKLIVALFVILVIGLVGSYATMGQKGGNVGQDTPKSQIEAYTSSIETLRADLKAQPKDYTTLSSLADALMKRGSLYAEAQDEANLTADFKEAVGYLETAYANQPEGLNGTGQALLLGKIAFAYHVTGDKVQAEANYQKALTADALNFDMHLQYTQFLVQENRAADALTLLNAYKAALPANDPNLANVDSIIGSVQAIIDGDAADAAAADKDAAEQPADDAKDGAGK